MGAGLGKTTGWIHRQNLRQRGVQMIAGAHYERVDDEGLHLRVGDGGTQLLSVDNIIICAVVRNHSAASKDPWRQQACRSC